VTLGRTKHHAELYEHMREVARAAGFDSVTAAIVAATKAPPGRPKFCVQIALVGGAEDKPILQWAPDSYGFSLEERRRMVGKYACYPVHDGGPLIEGEPERPRTVALSAELAEEVLQALLGGVVSDKTIAALATELRKVKQAPRVRGYMGDRGNTPFGPHD